MIRGWLSRLREQREARIVQRRAISNELWLETLESLPFLSRWAPDDLESLRRLTSLFLDEKEFSGAGGLEVTDAMAVRIAVQACMPVLRLGLQPYRSFVGIVVHPDEVVVPREVMVTGRRTARHRAIMARAPLAAMPAAPGLRRPRSSSTARKPRPSSASTPARTMNGSARSPESDQVRLTATPRSGGASGRGRAPGRPCSSSRARTSRC